MRDSEALLRVIFQAALAAGVDRNRLADALHCSPSFLDAPSGRQPHEMQPFFWSALETLTGNDEIGLELCPHLPAFDGHRLEYVLLSSATLRDGITFARRYRRVLSDAMQLVFTDREVAEGIELTATAYEAPQRRHTDICLIYAVLRALRIVPSTPPPVRIHLRTLPRLPPSEYERVFGCPVTFGAKVNSIELHKNTLDKPLPLANAEMASMHRRIVARRALPIDHQDIVDRVSAELYARSLSQTGVNATLPDMAARLGLSLRRIRDALSESGTSFRQLLTEIRAEVAEHLLAQTSAPMDYIARVAGFTDRTALSRSFSLMRGLPPLRFRRQAQARAGRSTHRDRLSQPQDVLLALKQKAERRLVEQAPV